MAVPTAASDAENPAPAKEASPESQQQQELPGKIHLELSRKIREGPEGEAGDAVRSRESVHKSERSDSGVGKRVRG